VTAIARTLKLRRPAVREILAEAGLEENRPPPTGHKRPDNVSPARLAAVAVGVMAQRIDDSFGLVFAGVVEELEGVFPGLGADELGSLARGLTIRLVQTATAIWFPSEYGDGDPAAFLAAKREVLMRRADLADRHGRPDDAQHWRQIADGCDARDGLVPRSGVLPRVSEDGLRLLVGVLRGGPARQT
jgi:hypothetical protein